MLKHALFILISFSAGGAALAGSDAAVAGPGDPGQAAYYRKLGDDYAAKEDLRSAAQAYGTALSIGSGLSFEEKMKMATAISWSDPAAAVKYLRALSLEAPANMKVRVALARALSWTGDKSGALKEIGSVLEKDPSDKEALLVKANALAVPATFKDAAAIYGKLLEAGENFDARAGLTEALLAGGDIAGASAAVKGLKPVQPYQQREVARLAAAIETAQKAALPAAAPAPLPAQDDVQSLKAALAGTRGAAESAELYRRLGDAYARKEDFKNSGTAYIAALSSGSFPAEDAVRMATNVSWNYPAEAVKEFRAMLVADPSFLKARVGLARTLSWTGANAEAVSEADAALKQSPGDRDALLVKANALRWQGLHGKARQIYSKLLEKSEDFDARAGLAYSLLAAGDLKGARTGAAALKAKYPYQETDLAALNKAIDDYARSSFDARASYYKDSDSNRIRRYSLAYGGVLGRFRTSLGFNRADASGTGFNNREDAFSAGLRAKLPWAMDAGAGIADNVVRNGTATSLLSWNASLNKTLPGGGIGLSAADSLLTDTAQLINNRIRTESYTISFNKDLGPRLSGSASYSYRNYSDVNDANDTQLSASYVLSAAGPRLAAGYRFRYLAFNRQSGGGYYDPSKYLTHQLFASFSFEKGRFYGSAEPYGGYQTQSRYSASTTNYYAGGSATLGYKPADRLALEASVEGGNYALQSATSFRYYQLGLRLLYRP
jgi:thioredoxin-like negative regulator of GroEL